MNYQKQNFPQQEKEILKFWEKEKIFDKSLEKTKDGPRFVFYEGPPFANGLPGIHHLVSRAFKDIIIRYKTMRGFFVERKAGWDTHGLPTEIAAEKKLGIKTKSDIEKIGVEKFIEACKESIFTYKKEWEEFTRRIGYWIDLKNAYITCKNNYIETLWWILKKIWEKGLLYEDYKVVPYCPRCGTSLSSHELAQGYKKIEEKSIYVKFKVKNQENTYFLVWTTTPWTLPGNVALAVGEDIDYVKVKIFNKHNSSGKAEYINIILAKNIFENAKKDNRHILANLFRAYDIDEEQEIPSDFTSEELIKDFKGKDLIGLEYEPLYDFIKPDKPAWRVIAGDFVSTEEGTGIVHIAPAFGEDDMKAGKENHLPVLMPVDSEGKFKKEIIPWAGMAVKKADGDDVNLSIIKDLEKRDLLFKKEMYEHDYPFCWRCDSPLIYYAKNSWFIKMTAVKKELLNNNEKINWIPKHLKKGRFGEWLSEVKDWNLTRERYWGAPLPVWECEKCGNIKVIGSIKELEKLSNEKVRNLHRPDIDKIILKCECGGEMKRVSEVIDCWFDSGAMPYAQWHYPFENKEKIDKGLSFPADFICEGIDQTRGWFYTLLAISTLLELGPSYKNVISHGLVLDSKGQKMSKSKGNIVKPQEIVDKFGADCARFYFYTANQAGEPKKFDMKEIQDLYRKFFGTLQNSFSFFETYVKNPKSKIPVHQSLRLQALAGGQNPKIQIKSQNLLDKWIISRLNNLNFHVVKNLDNYDIVNAARLFEDFVDDLSNWYIRRSRRRFQKPESEKEKDEASQTLYYVFLNLVKLLAPFMPFISERIFQNLLSLRGIPQGMTLRFHSGQAPLSRYNTGLPRFLRSLPMTESVHLCDWPEVDESLINEKLEEKMDLVREIVTLGLAVRAKAGIKIRQPLAKFKVQGLKFKVDEELINLIKEELNIKEVKFVKKIKKEKNWTLEGDEKLSVALKTKITPALKKEGTARELVRFIQEARKAAGYIPQDSILAAIVLFEFSPQIERVIKTYRDYIKKETGTYQLNLVRQGGRRHIDVSPSSDFDFEKEVILGGKKIWLGIKRKKF